MICGLKGALFRSFVYFSSQVSVGLNGESFKTLIMFCAEEHVLLCLPTVYHVLCDTRSISLGHMFCAPVQHCHLSAGSVKTTKGMADRKVLVLMSKKGIQKGSE